jgi:hypothetical protein
MMPLSGRADWPGALTAVAALATITYAIIVLPGGGVRSPRFAAAAVLALLSSATFAVTEWRASHPMLSPAIFRPAQFRAANAVTFVVNGALGGFALPGRLPPGTGTNPQTEQPVVRLNQPRLRLREGGKARQGARAPSRAGSRPDRGCPPP